MTRLISLRSLLVPGLQVQPLKSHALAIRPIILAFMVLVYTLAGRCQAIKTPGPRKRVVFFEKAAVMVVVLPEHLPRTNQRNTAQIAAGHGFPGGKRTVFPHDDPPATRQALKAGRERRIRR